MAEVTEIEQQEQNSDALIGGELLRRARTAQQLSIEHVARYLHLTDSVVQAIERSEIPRHVPVIYLRGYLRSYAKLLAVDAEQVLAGFQLRETAAAGISGIQNLQTMPTGSHRRSSSVRWLVLGVGVIVLLSLLLWWGWRGFPMPFAGATAPLPGVVVSATGAAAEVVSTTDAISVQLPLQLAPEDVLPGDLAAETAHVDASVTDAKPAPSTTTTPASVVVPAANVASGKTTDKVAKTADVAATKVETKTAKTADKNVESLSFSFAEDCWVRVTDARAEVLAVGTKRKGYRFTVAGVAPLKIDLGNPSGVEIRHNGRALDLSSYGKGKPARITINAPSTKTEAGTYE